MENMNLSICINSIDFNRPHWTAGFLNHVHFTKTPRQVRMELDQLARGRISCNPWTELHKVDSYIHTLTILHNNPYAVVLPYCNDILGSMHLTCHIKHSDFNQTKHPILSSCPIFIKSFKSSGTPNGYDFRRSNLCLKIESLVVFP
jgi:hypothetical protein